MGTYFNPSNEGFQKSSQDEIYIDKSGLLNILNKTIRKWGSSWKRIQKNKL